MVEATRLERVCWGFESLCGHYAVVAQLEEALHSECRGWRFESSQRHHFTMKIIKEGQINPNYTPPPGQRKVEAENKIYEGTCRRCRAHIETTYSECLNKGFGRGGKYVVCPTKHCNCRIYVRYKLDQPDFRPVVYTPIPSVWIRIKRFFKLT